MNSNRRQHRYWLRGTTGLGLRLGPDEPAPNAESVEENVTPGNEDAKMLGVEPPDFLLVEARARAGTDQPEVPEQGGGLPAGGGDTVTALAAAIDEKDVEAIYRIHEAVGNEQWREHADEVLALLSNAPGDESRDIAILIADAFFEDEGIVKDRTLASRDRTPQERGLVRGCLAYGALNNPAPDFREDRFQKIWPLLEVERTQRQGFREGQTGRRLITEMRVNADQSPDGQKIFSIARRSLLQLYPNINSLDLNTLHQGRREMLDALGLGRGAQGAGRRSDAERFETRRDIQEHRATVEDVITRYPLSPEDITELYQVVAARDFQGEARNRGGPTAQGALARALRLRMEKPGMPLGEISTDSGASVSEMLEHPAFQEPPSAARPQSGGQRDVGMQAAAPPPPSGGSRRTSSRG